MARHVLEYFLVLSSLITSGFSQDGTIKELIVKDSQFLNVFRQYLVNTKTLDDLGVVGDWYTVFAPVDQAFQDIAAQNINLNVLSFKERDELVKYHMVYHSIPNTRLEIRNDQSEPSHALNTPKLWFNSYHDRKTVNGARITSHIDANNGRIYYIDKVLYPIGTKDNIYAYIVNNFNTGRGFEELIEAANLDPLFNQIKGTVLLPNNMALTTAGGLDTTVRDKLIKDTPKLQKVLNGHIIEKEIWPVDRLEYISNIDVDEPRFDGLDPQNAAQTLDPDCKCTLAKRGQERYIMCGKVSAKILQADIVTDSGIIHVIDKLVNFVHSNAKDQIARDDELSDYMQAIQRETNKEMENYLGLANQQITVLAPVGIGFARLNQDTMDKIRDNQPYLKRLLNLHVIPSEEVIVRNIPVGGEVAFPKKSRALKDPNNPAGGNLMLRFYKDENDTYVEGGHTIAKILRMDVGVTNGIIHYIDHVLGAPYETIQEAIFKHPNLTRIQVYLRQINMWSLLGVLDQKFTIFVPTDHALWELRRSNPQMFQTPWSLKYVILRHFLNQTVFFFDETNDNSETRMLANNTNEIVLLNNGGYQYSMRYRAYSLKYTATVVKADIGCLNGALHIINTWMFVPGSEGDIIGIATVCRPSCIITLLSVLVVLYRFLCLPL